MTLRAFDGLLCLGCIFAGVSLGIFSAVLSCVFLLLALVQVVHLHRKAVASSTASSARGGPGQRSA